MTIPVSTGIRYLAQNARTGAWLDANLPLSEVTVKYALSGPTVISGKLTPEDPELADTGLVDYGTWVHWELDRRIMASGTVTPTTADGETLPVECEGPAGYPHHAPYDHTFSQVGVDAADIVREIWRHVQSYPNSNLGVTVVGTVGKKFGTPKVEADYDSGPYELQWWNNTNCGEEIRRLAEQAPFDYQERNQWNAARTDVDHFIDVKPRIGTRRDELRFAVGENVAEPPTPAAFEDYASAVLGLGKGEGSKKVRHLDEAIDPHRLRIVHVHADDAVDTVDKMRPVAAAQRQRRGHRLVFPKIVVDGFHDNAPFGSWWPGDDILVQATHLPWAGTVRLWHRVTALEVDPLTRRITADLARSDPA